MKHVVVEGTTEPQDFQLKNDGENLVGTGYTVAMEFRQSGVAGTCDWLSQANGTVRVSAWSGMAVGQTYQFRFKLTDNSGKVSYCPNGPIADGWTVIRA